MQFKVDVIDSSEPLEEDRLALHHRLRCQRAKIAEAKNSRAVGDDRDKSAFRRVIISCCRIFCDGPHGYSDAGRIGKAEVPLGRHRLGSDDLDFSRPSMRVEKQSLTLGKFDIGLVAHSAFLRSEEHTSELQSLMRISYAVFCLKKNKHNSLIEAI